MPGPSANARAPSMTEQDTGDRDRKTGYGRQPDNSVPCLMPPVPCPLKFGAVILAAGSSTRMGTPKQLLELEGKQLLVRAVEAALSSPAWPVVVVLGAHAELIRPAIARLPVLVTENPAWAEGMASSI